MIINDVQYIASYPKESQCPKDGLPEFAFIGRSNVGKSSLINYITDRKELAKVSKTPGKTKLLNYFLVDESWYLVDLPGYGYAKISKKQRTKWEEMLERYLQVRPTLNCVFLLIDSRIKLQKIDLEFMNWLGEKQIPFVLVYTKIDKLKKSLKEDHLKSIQTDILEHWTELPQQFYSSTVDKVGRDEILEFIGGLI